MKIRVDERVAGTGWFQEGDDVTIYLPDGEVRHWKVVKIEGDVLELVRNEPAGQESDAQSSSAAAQTRRSHGLTSESMLLAYNGRAERREKQAAEKPPEQGSKPSGTLVRKHDITAQN